MLKKWRNILSIMLITLMLITILLQGVINSKTQVYATSIIKIGDYVQLGRYYDEPILWRCVDIDENGPLMLSDRIISIKDFDSPGYHKYSDGTPQNNDTRTHAGSNLWETSNIRSWLNSTSTEGKVEWFTEWPSNWNIVNGYNYYGNEKGFLAESNFTSTEQYAIKGVTQKSLLNEIDVTKLSIGGTAKFTGGGYILDILKNYDNAYYHNVADKVFLLDVKQLKKVYLNSDILGYNYYIGEPTQKAIDNSEFKNTGITINNYLRNWTRTPSCDSYAPNCVVCVSSNGSIDSYTANYKSIGIRPAFYLNLSSVIFKTGKGTSTEPYIHGDVDTEEPSQTKKLSSPELVQPSSTLVAIDSDINIEWKPVDRAISYEVRIRDITKAQDESGDLILDTKTVNGNKIIISKNELLKPLVAENKYRLWISAYEATKNVELRGNTEFVFTAKANVLIEEWPAKTNVLSNKKWKIIFSSAIKASDVSSSKVYVTDENGSIIDTKVYLDAINNQVVYVEPIGEYEPNNTYILWIKEIKDLQEKSLKNNIKMKFTIDNDLDTSPKFSDITTSHYAYKEIKYMAEKGIIEGYADGTFKPNEPITRSEFAKILCKMPNIKLNNTEDNFFADISNDFWAYDYITKAQYIFTVYLDSEDELPYFMPSNNIDREDIATMIVKIKDLNITKVDVNNLNIFIDRNNISEQLKPYVAISLSNGYIKGTDVGFEPKRPITRAETCALLYRAFIEN